MAIFSPLTWTALCIDRPSIAFSYPFSYVLKGWGHQNNAPQLSKSTHFDAVENLQSRQSRLVITIRQNCLVITAAPLSFQHIFGQIFVYAFPKLAFNGLP